MRRLAILLTGLTVLNVSTHSRGADLDVYALPPLQVLDLYQCDFRPRLCGTKSREQAERERLRHNAIKERVRHQPEIFGPLLESRFALPKDPEVFRDLARLNFSPGNETWRSTLHLLPSLGAEGDHILLQAFQQAGEFAVEFEARVALRLAREQAPDPNALWLFDREFNMDSVAMRAASSIQYQLLRFAKETGIPALLEPAFQQLEASNKFDAETESRQLLLLDAVMDYLIVMQERDPDTRVRVLACIAARTRPFTHPPLHYLWERFERAAGVAR